MTLKEHWGMQHPIAESKVVFQIADVTFRFLSHTKLTPQKQSCNISNRSRSQLLERSFYVGGHSQIMTSKTKKNKKSESCSFNSPYMRHVPLSAHILCSFLNHLTTLVHLIIPPASTLPYTLHLPASCCRPLSVMSSPHV